MSLRRLPQTLINKIAAGEVIERPSAVVKELIENSIDARATYIDVNISDGGQSLISVSDNGNGMSSEELCLSVERHATSKLPDNDLVDIKFLGFRGEALPAIGAVSRLKIISKKEKYGNGWRVEVEGGIIKEPEPTAAADGTLVRVTDLFYATPARLKFLKSPKTEQNRILEIFKRIAMAHPEIAFTLSNERGKLLNFSHPTEGSSDKKLSRLSSIMGSHFAENSVPIKASREGFNLTGFAGLPTFNRSNSSMQFLFVNSRPVQDRMLFGALRGAYQSFLASNRYPVVVLFLEAPPNLVDVNVHPAKTEVRFQDQGLVRGLIVSSIKHALSNAGFKASTTVSEAALGAIKVGEHFSRPGTYSDETMSSGRQYIGNFKMGLVRSNHREPLLPKMDHSPSARSHPMDDSPKVESEDLSFPLGVARGQLHETYIIAQSNDGIIIIDQHAAHERLVEEKIKKSLAEGRLSSQGLLVPEVINLNTEDCERLLSHSKELADMGLVFEKFGKDSVIVRETPALLGEVNIEKLLQDLVDDIASYDDAFNLRDRINAVSATMACHSSVRAGRRLNADEMNSLLREMETTPYSGQCSHGRPTYVEIKLLDIEKLFGRT